MGGNFGFLRMTVPCWSAAALAQAPRAAPPKRSSLFSSRPLSTLSVLPERLDPSLKVGDIVRPARIVDAGDGSSAMLSNGDGVLVSFQSVASPTQKSKLRESFGALAVDMEAATVARTAEQRGIRFEVLKIISDESHFELPPLERFVEFRRNVFARPVCFIRSHSSVDVAARVQAGAQQRQGFSSALLRVARCDGVVASSAAMRTRHREIGFFRLQIFIGTSGTCRKLRSLIHL